MQNGIGQMTIRRDTPQTSGSLPSETGPNVLERFPAGGPRGSWPAEEYAAQRRAEGQPVTVVMNLATDTFDVKAVA
jgi:hypothetical protein